LPATRQLALDLAARREVQNGIVNGGWLVTVQLARDGKRYPYGWKLDQNVRNRAINLAHRWHCRSGLSTRQVQERLLSEQGIRRSLGSVHHDLKAFECEHCHQEVAQDA
jgi:hypothetical protein